MGSSIMMVPSSTMVGMPYTPINVYTPSPVVTPAAMPSSSPNVEVELKQVLKLYNIKFCTVINFVQCSFIITHIQL